MIWQIEGVMRAPYHGPAAGSMSEASHGRRRCAGLAGVLIGLALAVTSQAAVGGDAAASTGTAVPGTTSAARLAADLQQILARFLGENAQAPGVCAHVACPTLGLSWSGAAGTVARGSDRTLTPAHTFRIASNTKTYVAAAVLRLVEMGRLRLDDTLADLLPAPAAAPLRADGYDLEAMTLRQVLSHTSGLGDHSAGERYAEAIMSNPQQAWTALEQVQRCAEWAEPVGRPGERYVYSDTGYIILGLVIERLTDQDLGVAVRQLLDYRALGLTVTYWEYMEDPPAGAGPRAHQYYGDRDVTDWNASFDLYGGGGIVTDVSELARFMRELLQGRVLHHQATLAAMTGDGTAPYRLGLMCMEMGGHLAWGHQGFWNTFAYHVPALDLTVAGSILNHHAANGIQLADRLVARVAAEASR
jgi:D-alanyl-D-alanine carboxypeptidase